MVPTLQGFQENQWVQLGPVDQEIQKDQDCQLIQDHQVVRWLPAVQEIRLVRALQ